MRRARARIRVEGRFDGARVATVSIVDGLFVVRPFRRRRVFTLPLAAVAEGVIFDVVRAELRERARARAATARGRR